MWLSTDLLGPRLKEPQRAEPMGDPRGDPPKEHAAGVQLPDPSLGPRPMLPPPPASPAPTAALGPT